MYCRECEIQKVREWQAKNRDKVLEAKKRYSLKKLYGISYEQYKALLVKQNNSCALCKRHESLFKRRLAVDHNHGTGEIRGLLCNYCNHRLIGRHKDGTALRKMADYVDGRTGLFVPKKKRPKKRKRTIVNG